MQKNPVSALTFEAKYAIIHLLTVKMSETGLFLSVVCRSPPFREPRLGCERAGALPMNFSIGVMNLIAKSRYCVMYLKLGGTAGDLVP